MGEVLVLQGGVLAGLWNALSKKDFVIPLGTLVWHGAEFGKIVLTREDAISTAYIMSL